MPPRFVRDGVSFILLKIPKIIRSLIFVFQIDIHLNDQKILAPLIRGVKYDILTGLITIYYLREKY